MFNPVGILNKSSRLISLKVESADFKSSLANDPKAKSILLLINSLVVETPKNPNVSPFVKVKAFRYCSYTDLLSLNSFNLFLFFDSSLKIA
ncbi:hypothetical protein NW065_04115 [Mycoplasmopsis cynos]|nr:hypothetical protein [Mycoplasmopsis cynos]UWV81156.1 hypothetical protein NW065_04115 [Mycoplasmopsis cynos]UWV92677.1 hypothetical protein NWE57_01020 [Mycoplasmopsis cynos]WAM04918.1 hypothetical protein ONA01_01790 [Mycoplasmopsis cynos]WAM07375.1 hypothetical protein ONA21_04200 [Mycoplasmopsis cynos]WAM11097.1 hypothetical protein ONA00_01045 [Mycoplasmopsis cynos]